jgi:propionyl-CoA synthetase
MTATSRFTAGLPAEQLNTCYNALDVHVENGSGDQAALIYDSPVTDTIKTYTYTELRDEVANSPVSSAQGSKRATGS